MKPSIQNQRSICIAKIALAESIDSSKSVADLLNSGFIKGAQAALRLLNRRLALQQAKSSTLDGHAVLITRQRRYAEMEH